MKTNPQALAIEDQEQQIYESTIEHIKTLLSEGYEPQKIAEELVFIAVDISLQLSNQKESVFPILLGSMLQAFQTNLKKSLSGLPTKASTQKTTSSHQLIH